MAVNKERIELLAQALESGEYEQCKGALRRWYDKDGSVAFTYCAEGVAVRVAPENDENLRSAWWKDHWERFGHPTQDILRWYGFNDTYALVDTEEGPQMISQVNDKGADFWTIAQALRATYLKDEG